MEIARYICLSCNTVRVTSIRDGASVFLRSLCGGCGRLASAVLEQLKTVPLEDYINDGRKALDDSESSSLTAGAAADIAMFVFNREIDSLKAQNTDLRDALTQLKEFSQEKRGNENSLWRQEWFDEIIEHCEVSLGEEPPEVDDEK